MLIQPNVHVRPLPQSGPNPRYYIISQFKVAVPDGLSSLSFTGENGETYVVSVKVRQELDPHYRNQIWLNKEYVERERSMADIADQFGITPAAINQWLIKHDIPTRKRGSSSE
tara:strand:- start:29 stop:367 length:339 start_codon:yes stop_codon:yes gene_type:complete